jgi:multidrug efflux system membrane fusion protein
VQQAEANVQRDEAQAKLSAVQTTRYEGLTQKGVVSREQNDQIRTTNTAQLHAVEASKAALESAHANVRAAEAAVEDARVRLGYTQIRAPITGRTGTLTVKEGNLVTQNGTTPLVVINQISPIYVSFALPEQNLDAVKRRMREGKLRVEAMPSQGVGQPSVGTLTFIDNAVDATTGTIRLKATFPNQGGQLWPGQFANVILTLETERDAVLVPSQAVNVGQNGSYVLVVNPDLKAEMRPVVSTRIYNQLAIIDKGLQPGERVVTDGQLKVVPGATVDIQRSSEERRSTPGAS